MITFFQTVKFFCDHLKNKEIKKFSETCRPVVNGFLGPAVFRFVDLARWALEADPKMFVQADEYFED